MQQTILLILLITLAGGIGYANAATLTDEVKSAWKFDFNGLTLDPSNWTSTVKSKVFKSAVGTGYVTFLGVSLPMSIGWFCFLYGLVKLDWMLVFLSCVAFRGWKSNQKVHMLAGFLSVYCYAFGYKILS